MCEWVIKTSRATKKIAKEGEEDPSAAVRSEEGGNKPQVK